VARDGGIEKKRERRREWGEKRERERITDCPDYFLKNK
jgi:hypothetical protein